MLKSQGRSFETSQKPTTFEPSLVEVGKYMYGRHCGSTPHLMWV
jgi:hypothetical protein